MPYPQMQIVSGPHADATIVYDFNARADEHTAERKPLREGFNFGAPRRQGEADAYAPSYDGQELTWRQRFVGTKPAVMRGLSTMMLHLNRGPAWLRWKLDEDSAPYWFRTRWHDLDALDFEHVAATAPQDIWTLPIALPVEPYAYGALVEHDTQVVVSNPAAASGGAPARVVLPPIVGDAPAPLRLSLSFGSVLASPTVLCELNASGTTRLPVQIPVGTEAGVSSSTDTAAGTTVAGAIGGTARVCNFASDASLTTRIYGTTPALAPGRYRVMLRVQSYATTLRFQFAASGQGGDSRNRLVTEVFDVNGSWRYVDLGVHSIPFTLPLDGADFGADLPALWSVRIARLAGAQTVTLDHLELIPVDLADTVAASSCRIDFNSVVPTTTTLTADGDTEAVWFTAGTGTLETTSAQPVLRGVFPKAVPGLDHVLHLLVNTNNDTDAATRTINATVAYRPRYTLIGDA